MNAEDRELISRALDALSGSNEALFKSAADEDADLEAFVDTLSEQEAAELLAEFGPSEEQRAGEAREGLAKEAARSAFAPLAKSTPEQQLAAVAWSLEREEIRERQERVLADMRDGPTHGTSWLYNQPTATADQAADMVMSLKRAGASR